MTPKTETLYRPKNERAARILKSDFLFEPVEVHVGEYYWRNVIKDSIYLYEKVTHVLPMAEPMSPKQISGTSEDQLRDDTKKLEMILKIGELIHDKIGLQKQVELKTEVALEWERKFKALHELFGLAEKTIAFQEKELEEEKKIPANEGRVIRESIEGQKETIESQKNEIERLKAELSNLRSYHNLVVGFANQDREGISRLIEEKNRLKSELEEAKKGGAWKKYKDGDSIKAFCVSINKDGSYKFGFDFDTMDWYFELPNPPNKLQPRTLDEQAEEDWENLSNEKRTAKEIFIAGFKAAKEAQNG